MRHFNPLVIIPSRMAAERLPGKPLVDIGGLPMIVQVMQRAERADIGPVIVACDGEEIKKAVGRHGGQVVITDPALPSGTDRVHAAAEAFDPKGEHDIIINVQGDIPTVDPATIKAVLEPLEDPAFDIATPVALIREEWEKTDPAVVKPILSFHNDRIARALYFTRATAPSGPGPLYHHVGIYAFRREALHRFVSLRPSSLEKRERLEQLRALEAGMSIGAVVVEKAPLGVDTKEQLERVRQAFESQFADNPAG
jgi:3-deoxy-manno-octulosonate cytidylyltransferase (CMP-KDO synthetase)